MALSYAVRTFDAAYPGPMDGEFDALLPNDWSASVSRQGGSGLPAALRTELHCRGEMRCLIVALNQTSPEAASERVRLAIESFLERQERAPRHTASPSLR